MTLAEVRSWCRFWNAIGLLGFIAFAFIDGAPLLFGFGPLILSELIAIRYTLEHK